MARPWGGASGPLGTRCGPPGAGGGRAVKAIPRRCRSGPFFPQALVGGLLPAGAGLTAGGRIKGNGSTGR